MIISLMPLIGNSDKDTSRKCWMQLYVRVRERAAYVKTDKDQNGRPLHTVY